MVHLARTVRFCLQADGTLAADAAADNSFAAWPPMRGLGRYYELNVCCRGDVDPVTGYFMNIKAIDRATREVALPVIADRARADPDVPLGSLMRDVFQTLGPALDHTVQAVELRLTPTYSLRIESKDMNTVLISQQYEFSAAHRLHAERLSDDENREVFGKCNNPAGHGHNYRLEVTVRGPIADDGHGLPVERLDALVDETVIQRLDHKNLDVDVPEFEKLNTTVEHIARVIYGMLGEPVRSLGLELERVRVWETGKTVCTYPA